MTFYRIIHREGLKNIGAPTDISLSNVQGPKKAFYYAGSKVKFTVPLSNPGMFSNSFVIISYGDEFMFSIVSDDFVKADLGKLTKMVEKELIDLMSNE